MCICCYSYLAKTSVSIIKMSHSLLHAENIADLYIVMIVVKCDIPEELCHNTEFYSTLLLK